MKTLHGLLSILFIVSLAGCGGGSSTPQVTGSQGSAVLSGKQVPVRILLKTDNPDQYVPVVTILGTTYENIPANTVLIGMESLSPIFPRLERWSPDSPPGPMLVVSLQASGTQGLSGTKLSSSIRGTLYDKDGRPYEMFRGAANAKSGSAHARVVYKTHRTALAEAYQKMAAELLNWEGLDYFINENR